MKTLSDAELLDLHELCNALADGTITPEAQARLTAMLRESEEVRRFYVRSMDLSASLYQYAGEMLAEAPDDAATSRSRRILTPAFWRLAGPLAAAALLVAAFWLGGNHAGTKLGRGSAEVESEETVARLSGAKGCRWSGQAAQLGDELRAGQRLELTEGAAEITFDSGAQVTMEAPASLEVASAWNAKLNRGSLKVSVPAEAVGFRVANPTVDVVDLGTEFSMVAEESGGTEVIVLKGAVEATARDAVGGGSAPLLLREKQGRHFARSGISEVRDREQKLARFSRKLALESATTPVGYAHWSFDDLNGFVAPAITSGLASGGYDAKPSAGEPLANPQTEGRWHGALHLDGNRFWSAAFPDLSKHSARTIAFWTRIAPETELSSAGPIVAWVLPGTETRPIEIAWNRNPAEGAFGALQTRVGRRFVVATTPLRDGRWHHVAVVLIPHWKNENALQVKQYVDGRLEGVTARYGIKRHAPANRRGNDAPEMPRDLLAVGGAPGSTDAFRGDLDELFVCDRVLAPREIAHLMRANQPIVPELVAVE